MISVKSEEVAMQQAPANAIRDVENQISALFTNGRTFLRQAARLVHPDLLPSGLHLMRMLDKCGPMRPSTLAGQMDVDRSAISRLITSLDELGLIERTPDPKDKRAQMVAISEEGKQRLDALKSDTEGPIRVALREWDEEDIAALAQLLARLNAYYADDLPGPAPG